jgi:hypothetical protein
MSTIAVNRKTSSFGGIIGKDFAVSVFLFFSFMVSFRVLLVSPIPELELGLELLYEVFLIGYLGYRIINRIISRNFGFNNLELYLFVLLLLPVQASIAAWHGYGQPLYFGLGTYRDFYLIISPLVVYNMLRNKTVTIEMVERMFLLTAWTCVLMFYGMSLFTNPDAHIESAAAGSNSAKGGEAYYRFNMAFIFFGTIYYFAKALYQKKSVYFFYAGFFMIYVLFMRFDRTSITALAGALTLMYFTALPLKKQTLIILAITIPSIVIGFGGYLIVPEAYHTYYYMFLDAFATLPGGVVATQEESVRIDEVRIALENIEKRPYFGNGKISGRWVEGGYSYFFGFFYASDVGIFGQVFMYGFVGATVLYFQFILSLIYSLKIKYIKRNIFLTGMKFFLVALVLDSITNGYITIYAAQTVTAMVIIFYFYQKDRIIGVQLKMADASGKSDSLTESGSNKLPA